MDTRAKILEIPRFLRDALEKGVHDYETLIRRVRWGESPVYICACGASLPVAMAGAYMFEWLAGRPTLALSAKVFEAYTVSTLRPRSIVLVISASGEDPDALEIARLARSRGAVPLALTRSAASPLAEACEGVLLTWEEGAEDSAATAFCQLAALSNIALVAVRFLKPTAAGIEALEEELKRLPEQLEWCFTQLSDALRSLAHELCTWDVLYLAGGGPYYPVAERAARRLSAFSGIHCVGIEASQITSGPLLRLGSREGVVFVSGSHLRMKRAVHQAAAQLKAGGAKIISLTDGNDRDLVDRSHMAILVPSLSEVGGSMLALALLDLLITYAAKHAAGSKPAV